MLVLVSQKFEEDKGLCQTTRTIQPMKFYASSKIKDGSATNEPLLLASQKSAGNQGWYLKNDNENNEINESL